MVTSVSVNDPGLTSGYGLFETLRVYNGIPFLVEAHVERLLNSCQALSFADIGKSENLIELIYQYIKKLKLTSRAIRISVTYGIETEGFAPNIFLSNRAISYLSSDYEEGITAAISPYRKNEYSPIVYHKTFNQLENILSLKHCQEKKEKVKECIFLNTSGYLAEGSKSNLFFVREGKIFTPWQECGILPGITREKVIDLLKRQGIEVMEGTYRRDELVAGDECFCTNSLMEVMPVVKIDDRCISGSPGKLTKLALSLYRECINIYVNENNHLI